MTVEERYRERYKAGDTPWDLGEADFNLIEVVRDTPIAGCPALDIGCGTGDNAIWLAQNGFRVSATDASEEALIKARQKAAQAGAACTFLALDFLEGEVPGAPFGFAFDRGCFHSFASADDRGRLAANVAAHLAADGLWLSLIGNADEVRNHPGPPQRTAVEIVSAVEPHFEVLRLATTHFGSKSPKPPRAWRCLMRKRPPA